MLHQFIDYIKVFHTEKIEGKRLQRVEIYYNCVGSVELPNHGGIPFPEIEVKTRKGVAVSYAPPDADAS